MKVVLKPEFTGAKYPELNLTKIEANLEQYQSDTLVRDCRKLLQAVRRAQALYTKRWPKDVTTYPIDTDSAAALAANAVRLCGEELSEVLNIREE
jgi:hypothetical protein